MSFVFPALLSAALLALATPALPADPPKSADPSPAPVAPPPGRALTSADLDQLSGGAGVKVEAISRQQLSGMTSGNTVTAGSITSGPITFSPDALNGFSGIGNFVVNTGANNTLQGAVNISVVPASTP